MRSGADEGGARALVAAGLGGLAAIVAASLTYFPRRIGTSNVVLLLGLIVAIALADQVGASLAGGAPLPMADTTQEL